MQHTPINNDKPRVPVWKIAEEGRRDLGEIIDAFVARAADRHDDDRCEVLALRVTAGSGKTGTTLRALAKHADRLIPRGNILVYLPTLDLAERAESEFRQIAPGIPSTVVRGRQANRPGDLGERMCTRHDLAKKVASIVPSVTEALCRSRRADGTIWDAPCAAGCPYLAQRKSIGARVVFLTHAYLLAQPPIDPEVPTALRIIDEKVWPTLARTIRITLEDFMRQPAAGFPHVLRAVHAKAKSAIVEALQNAKPISRALREAGVDRDVLSSLAAEEGNSQDKPDIRPWDGEAEIHGKIDVFDQAKLRTSFAREAVFAILTDAEGEGCNRLSFREEITPGGARQIIKVHKLTRLPKDAPMLLLDADADPEITECVAPGATFHSIDIRPDAEVIQVEDRTVSNSWLLEPQYGPARRRQILELIKREVARSGEQGVLVVAPKSILAVLHQDAGQAIEAEDDAGLMKPLCGAQPRWFGPRMQGVNDFEAFGTALIVGRLQPPPSDIEDSARCLFGDEATAVIEVGSGHLPERDTYRHLANGELVDATFRCHPDPRASAILRQMRECQSLQAIARLRLVTPRQPKRVVILSSLPLPDFPVTRLIPFEVVCRGLEAEPDPHGFMRLEKALRATMGQTVQGTRLSAAGLAEDLPSDFPSVHSAKHFRRGRTTQQLIALVERIAGRNGWPLTVLNLRRPQGGKLTPAIMLAEATEAKERAMSLWPGFTSTRATFEKFLPGS